MSFADLAKKRNSRINNKFKLNNDIEHNNDDKNKNNNYNPSNDSDIETKREDFNDDEYLYSINDDLEVRKNSKKGRGIYAKNSFTAGILHYYYSNTPHSYFDVIGTTICTLKSLSVLHSDYLNYKCSYSFLSIDEKFNDRNQLVKSDKEKLSACTACKKVKYASKVKSLLLIYNFN